LVIDLPQNGANSHSREWIRYFEQKHQTLVNELPPKGSIFTAGNGFFGREAQKNRESRYFEQKTLTLVNELPPKGPTFTPESGFFWAEGSEKSGIMKC